MSRADFNLVPCKALTLLNWNHSKYGGRNIPSINDFPPAGKKPSGKTWKKTVKENAQEKKEANQIDQITESSTEPSQTAEIWKGAICWSASSENSRLYGSHAGTAPWFSCSAPWAQPSQAHISFDKNKKLETLRRPGGHVILVAGTYHLSGYHSKDPCQLSPNNK
jgi:hypothetical protein